MKMKPLFYIMILILLSGCLDNKGDISTPIPTVTAVSPIVTITEPITTETTEDIPEPTDTITTTETPIETPIVTSTPKPIITATEVVPTPTTDVVQYNIGQSVNNGKTKITINSMRFSEKIGDNSSNSGNQFLIINITIENIGSGDLSYSAHQFVILDTDEDIETIYQVDESILSNLPNMFNGENIKPGDKRQGEFAYNVPNNAKGLKLKFEYSDLTSEFFSLN